MPRAPLGYSYTKSGTSFTATDSTQLSPKPGEALYVGETTPDSGQTGDVWLSSSRIRRWDGFNWSTYYGPSSSLRAGTVTFTGSSVTVPFSTNFNLDPAVVITPVTGYNDTSFYATQANTSNFKIRSVSTESGSSKSGTYTVNWIAAEKGSSGRVQAGEVNGSTTSSGTIAVTFPVPYPSAPIVNASISNVISSQVFSIVVQNITTTGFTVKVYDEEGFPINYISNIAFFWISIRPGGGG